MDAAEEIVDEGIDDVVDQIINEDIEEETHQENPDELKAAKMGWVPKEEFRGDPSKWRPAEEFLERGEKMIPILNAKIRNLEKRQSEKDKAFTAYLEEMRNKLHSQKVAEHEGRKQQAVEEGDTDTYNRLSNETPINDLPEYIPPAQDNDPVFDEWLDENTWYKNDYERYQEADNYGRFLKSTNPDLMGRDFLDEVSKHVRQKFSNPNRTKPSAVDGGTQKASGKSLYASLEAEAKATFSSFVREGIFKNTVEDREAYAKDVLG